MLTLLSDGVHRKEFETIGINTDFISYLKDYYSFHKAEDLESCDPGFFPSRSLLPPPTSGLPPPRQPTTRSNGKLELRESASRYLFLERWRSAHISFFPQAFRCPSFFPRVAAYAVERHFFESGFRLGCPGHLCFVTFRLNSNPRTAAKNHAGRAPSRHCARA